MSWAHGYAVLSGLNPNVKFLAGAGANVAVNSGWIDCDLTANGNQATVAILIQSGIGDTGAETPGIDGLITAYTVELALSGSPTSTLDLFGGAGTTNALFRINTSKQIECYDKNGTLLTTSSSTISTAKASPTKLVLVVDSGVTDANLVYLWLVFDGTEDATVAGFNTGLAPSAYCTTPSGGSMALVGVNCPAGSNPGVTLSFRNFVARVSADSADAPYTSAYPDIKVAGGQSALPPTAESSFNWTNSVTASPNTYQDIDDTSPDADTSRIWDSQTTDPKTAHDAYYTYSGSNPLTSSDHPLFVQFVYRGDLLGSGKDFCQHEIKVGTSVAQHNGSGPIPANGTYQTYIAQYDTDPSTSTAFLYSAFAAGNIKFGVQSVVAPSIDTGPEITAICGPEIVYYTAVMSLLSSPSGTVPAVTQRRRGVVI